MTRTASRGAPRGVPAADRMPSHAWKQAVRPPDPDHDRIEEPSDLGIGKAISNGPSGVGQAGGQVALRG